MAIFVIDCIAHLLPRIPSMLCLLVTPSLAIARVIGNKLRIEVTDGEDQPYAGFRSSPKLGGGKACPKFVIWSLQEWRFG
jgi:hypothetical protein